jgi:hypothetical protein
MEDTFSICIVQANGREVIRTGTSREIAEIIVEADFTQLFDGGIKFSPQTFIPENFMEKEVQNVQKQLEAGTWPGLKLVDEDGHEKPDVSE